jgi:hypothetical protein
MKKSNSFFDDAARIATGVHPINEQRRVCIGKIKIIFIAVTTILALIIEYCGLYNIAESVSAQPLEITAGVFDNTGAFVESTDANPGEEMLIQMSFSNISGDKFEKIAAHIELPPQLEYVEGSTFVYNRTNPTGLHNDDGIASEWIDLGGYRTFSKGRYGAGIVSFRVRVVDNPSLYVAGKNTLKVACEIAAYNRGVIATDPHIAYCAVDVIQE